SAFYVAANNEYHSLPNDVLFNSNPSGGVRSWTMGAWVKPASTAATGSICQKGSNTRRDWYARMDAGGAPRLFIYSGDGNTTLKDLISANALTAGVYSYVIWGLDVSGGAAATKSFIKVGDNALEESAAFNAGTLGVNDQALRVAGDAISGNEFDGDMDNVIRFNRLLTSAEMAELQTYNGG
ncbi:MAG: LamG domain-containing protein, partial [Planctomycetales bacterium]